VTGSGKCYERFADTVNTGLRRRKSLPVDMLRLQARMGTMKATVFSYGSNMCRQRLCARVPLARALEPAWLGGYAFRMHKRGYDGSGKADAHYTGDAADRLWGVLFEIRAADWDTLDRAEGVGVGYDRHAVTVLTADGTERAAELYVARREWVCPRVVPFTWYKRFVTHGAEQHGLPPDYRRFLEDHHAVHDPDPRRHAKNVRILDC
jgi:gamma-glutamylcyclotransferase (GGCT)/AIG2-like uncharacterized protein YtfP